MIRTVLASCAVYVVFAAAAVAQNNTQLCMQPPEVGVWQNEFAETHQVSRLEIAFHCDGNGPYGRWFTSRGLLLSAQHRNNGCLGL